MSKTDATTIAIKKYPLTAEEIKTIQHAWSPNNPNTDFAKVCKMALWYIELHKECEQMLGADYAE